MLFKVHVGWTLHCRLHDINKQFNQFYLYGAKSKQKLYRDTFHISQVYHTTVVVVFKS